VVLPPPLTAAIMKPIEQVTRQIYAGIEVVPVLQAAGTDAIYLATRVFPPTVSAACSWIRTSAMFMA